MSTYIVANLTIHDRDGYRVYEEGFMDVFRRYEGRMLAVDEHCTALEGEHPFTRTVIIEFPSEAAARAWYDSDAYQALAEHRHASSDGNIVMLTGLA